jgi:hypothetical protein
MRVYEFTLRFTLPSGELPSDDMVERLGEEGCDDALIGVGRPGRISLEFSRTARSAREAILSAIDDVKRALADAELAEVTPDLVGVTDIANLVGRTRQNVRQLMISGGSSAPAPLHEGESFSVWHLATVLAWLSEEKDYSISSELLELSDATMKVNAAVDALKADRETVARIRSLFA